MKALSTFGTEIKDDDDEGKKPISEAITASICSHIDASAEDPVFPTTVKFGTATSSYQVEGAWNVSDKGVSNWDTYVHNHGVADNSTGDVACDSYHQWKRDIDMLVELGVDFYRFSLSWPRLLPSGFSNRISEDGKNYYNSLINGLLEKGIEPMVTIYHWDLPQPLQDLGGWANPLITDWFAEYSRAVFTLFGDRVKTWITINEPIAVCDGSYTMGILAPGVLSKDDIGTYLCTKNVLVAHAKAWRIYDKEFRSKFKGQISYSNNLLWNEEKTAESAELAELSRQSSTGRYSHAVFSKEGGWPPTLEKLIAKNSAKQGYPESRLPAFTKEEIELVRGTFDFYGVNFYTSRLVSPLDPENSFGFPFMGSKEIGAIFTTDPTWKMACNGWMAIHPEGIRKQLVWLKQQYGDLKFLITENGYPTCVTDNPDVDDQDRIAYYRLYLTEIKKAMTLGVNVVGYTAWSLMDNFEWMDGYRSKFGLYAVNFTDPQRTRTPRKSASYYTEIIRTRVYVEPSTTNKCCENSYSLWYILVGVLIVLGIIGGVVVFVKRRKNKKDTTAAAVDNITPLMPVETDLKQ